MSSVMLNSFVDGILVLTVEDCPAAGICVPDLGSTGI